MKKYRPLQESDQENTEKAFNLIKKLMINHPEIESTLWASATWSILADGYKNSDFNYEEFVQETERIIEHFKIYWNDED